MGKFLDEFKTFAMRGNVVDLAVGVVMGGAFGKITTSVVNDIIMPAISVLTGGLNFTDWKVVLRSPIYNAAGAEIQSEIAINYGNLISTVMDFVIIAFAVFCMVKVLNKLYKKKEEPAPAPAEPELSAEEKLLTEIRDLLKEQR